MTAFDAPQGLYFEDYQVGQKLVTRGRTTTEADIVAFAGLTGDYNPMHTDAEYMKSTAFGQRIAHGMLTLSYAVGQAYQLGFMERTVLAFRGLEMKFSLPVFIGDTLHVELTVREKKEAARMGGGLVTLDVKIINQQGKTAQSGEWIVLIASRAAQAKQNAAVTADAAPDTQRHETTDGIHPIAPPANAVAPVPADPTSDGAQQEVGA